MQGEIEQHRHADRQHAEADERRRPPKQPPIALADDHAQGHDQRAHGKGQTGVLDPQHASAEHANGIETAARKFVPLAMKHPQRGVEHIRGHGQRKFLGAVAKAESAVAVDQHAQERKIRQRAGLFPEVKGERLHQEKQRRRGGEHFQRENFQKGIDALKGQPLHTGVQEVQKRPFLLVNVPIEHAAPGDGLADGVETLRVDPGVGRIKERTGTHQRQYAKSRREAKAKEFSPIQAGCNRGVHRRDTAFPTNSDTDIIGFFVKFVKNVTARRPLRRLDNLTRGP